MDSTTRSSSRRHHPAWTILKRLFAGGQDRPTQRSLRPTLEALEDRLVPSIYTYQQGVNGYTSTDSADISSLGGGNGEDRQQ